MFKTEGRCVIVDTEKLEEYFDSMGIEIDYEFDSDERDQYSPIKYELLINTYDEINDDLCDDIVSELADMSDEIRVEWMEGEDGTPIFVISSYYEFDEEW